MREEGEAQSRLVTMIVTLVLSFFYCTSTEYFIDLGKLNLLIVVCF
jgi:hypothetical protein